MRNLAVKRILGGSVVAGLVGISAVLFLSPGPMSGMTQGSGGAGGAALAAASSSPFTIQGNATQPISPGISAPINLRLTNPNAVSVSVIHVIVTLRKVSAPKAGQGHPCTVADFSVQQASGSRKLTLAARSTSTLSDLGLPQATWPRVSMVDRPVDQDGCEGASLTLDFASSGTRDRP